MSVSIREITKGVSEKKSLKLKLGGRYGVVHDMMSCKMFSSEGELPLVAYKSRIAIDPYSRILLYFTIIRYIIT